MNKFTALVIDDDEGICAEITERLAVIDHTCHCVNNVMAAKEYLENETCDYIILDMELPLKYGDIPEICVGERYLKILRGQYPKETMPILVITAHAARRADLASNVIFNDATDFILKPLQQEGEHTLESSIAKFVDGNSAISSSPAGFPWLARKINGKKIIWQATARNGNVHTYEIGAETIRCMLLDCIFKNYRKSPVINHYDIMSACGWREKAYFAKNGGAPRGPLKGHIEVLRKDFGLDIIYVDNGIKLTQPEQ